MCTIRIVRSKRINKTRFGQRLIGRTSVREWNESTIYGLGSLFDSIFLETKRQRKNFYSSSSSSSRIHIFNRPLIPLFSHRQRCVIVFEMRSIRRQSPIPPLPKKNRLVLYQIFIFAHLYAHLITPMLSNFFRIYFKFYINSPS